MGSRSPTKHENGSGDNLTQAAEKPRWHIGDGRWERKPAYSPQLAAGLSSARVCYIIPTTPHSSLSQMQTATHPTDTPSSTLTAVAGIMLVIFLFAIDATIVSSALPTVAAQLGGLELYSWVFSVYMLASALATPIFGKLSDLFNHRRLMLFGIGTFILGSLLCGAAQNMQQLVWFRVLQGIGGGAIYALAFIIVGVVFPPEKRSQMQGLISSVWGISSILGPLGGGLIAEHWNWRWIFWINLPIGLVAGALLVIGFSEPAAERRQRRNLDIGGAMLLVAGLFFLFYALLISAQKLTLLSVDLLGLIAAALLFLALFALVERRVTEPILPSELFRIPDFTVPTLLAMLAAMGIFGVIGFVPMYVQGVLGGSAALAGMVLLPLSLGWTSGNLISGFTAGPVSHRSLCVIGMLLMVGGTLAFLFVVAQASGIGATVAAISSIGVGMGMVNVTTLVAAQGSVPPYHIGVATSTIMLFRTFGGALALSLMGSVLYRQMHGALLSLTASFQGSLPGELSSRLANPRNLLEPESRSLIPEAILPALTRALGDALWDAFLVGLLAVVLGLALSLKKSRK